MFSNSSINWCERDYVKSRFIAEFWNTLTGICLCISSIVCYKSNIKKNVYVLYYSNLLLFIVGIGTILFHSTLIYIWQLLDEIPMMLIVIEYYRLLTQQLNIRKYVLIYGKKPRLLTIYYKNMYYILPFIITSYYIHPKLHVFLFQSTLVLCIIFLIYTCYIINSLLSYPNRTTNIYRNLRPIIVTRHAIEIEKIKYNLVYYHYKGILILLISLVIWNIDNNYCQHYIELHAVWHIMTSIGMYYCNEIIKSYIILFKINLIVTNKYY